MDGDKSSTSVAFVLVISIVRMLLIMEDIMDYSSTHLSIAHLGKSDAPEQLKTGQGLVSNLTRFCRTCMIQKHPRDTMRYMERRSISLPNGVIRPSGPMIWRHRRTIRPKNPILVLQANSPPPHDEKLPDEIAVEELVLESRYSCRLLAKSCQEASSAGKPRWEENLLNHLAEIVKYTRARDPLRSGHLLDADSNGNSVRIPPVSSAEKDRCQYVVDDHEDEVRSSSIHDEALEETMDVPRYLQGSRESGNGVSLVRAADRAGDT
eukprot:760119-Hanusia_phi.AAC.1